jgi:hypothetical protein
MTKESPKDQTAGFNALLAGIGLRSTSIPSFQVIAGQGLGEEPKFHFVLDCISSDLV